MKNFLANKFVKAAAIVFAIRAIILFLDPGFAFGRSMGLEGSAIVLAIMGLSVAITCFAMWMILPRLLSGKNLMRGFVGASIVLSFAVNFGLNVAADRDFELNRFLVTNQIEFFCADGFHRETCVKLVLSCSECVLDVDRWKRDQIIEKLKAFRSQYPRQPAQATTSKN